MINDYYLKNFINCKNYKIKDKIKYKIKDKIKDKIYFINSK